MSENKFCSFSRILDQIQDSILICNLAGVVEYCNPRTRRILGLNPDTQINQPLALMLTEYQNIGKWVTDTNRILAGEAVFEQISLKTNKLETIYFEKNLSEIEIRTEKMILITLKELHPASTLELNPNTDSIPFLQASTELTDIIAREGVQKKSLLQALEVLGKTLQADRVYLFKNSLKPETGTLQSEFMYEWNAPGISPKEGKPNWNPLMLQDQFPDWFSILHSGGFLNAIVREMDIHSQKELKQQDVQSFVFVPLHILNNFWGFIGIDSCQNERLWQATEITFLKINGNTLALALEKQDFLASLQSMVKEKEIMLNELNHRTKNNLALIYGLIDFQNTGVSRPDLIAYSENIKQRIQNISLIHEVLSTSGKFSELSFSQYIQLLVHKLENAFLSGKTLTKQYNLEDFELTDLNQMVTLGVLINEILINAFKHAFSKVAKPEISINTYRLPQGVVIRIKDNGTGMDNLNSPFENPETVGLKIIKGLIDQLRAELIFQSHNGTEYIIVLEKLKVKSPGN